VSVRVMVTGAAGPNGTSDETALSACSCNPDATQWVVSGLPAAPVEALRASLPPFCRERPPWTDLMVHEVASAGRAHTLCMTTLSRVSALMMPVFDYC